MPGSQLPPEGGRGMLMVALLVLLVAILLGWAYLASPLGAPNPASTGVPVSAPS